MQGREKITALKPLASRPSSTFRSFSRRLQDFTATDFQPITDLEEANLIRPKATRITLLPSDLPTEISATIVSLTPEFYSSNPLVFRKILSYTYFIFKHLIEYFQLIQDTITCPCLNNVLNSNCRMPVQVCLKRWR
jgi:hypothetical protein